MVGVFSDPAFWVGVSSVLFLLLLAKFGGKTVIGTLDNRAENIRNDINEAIRLKEEAQTLLASTQRKHRKAIEESEKIIIHAQEEAERIIADSRVKLEEELARKTDMAMQRIARMEQGVSQEIRDNAIEYTVAAARQLITEHLGKEMAEDIVAKAIYDAGQKLH